MSMTHKEKDKLIQQMKAEILRLRKENVPSSGDGDYIALSFISDPSTRTGYLYEVEFDPKTAKVISRKEFVKSPWMAEFEAKKILHEKILKQDIKREE